MATTAMQGSELQRLCDEIQRLSRKIDSLTPKKRLYASDGEPIYEPWEVLNGVPERERLAAKS